MSITNSIPLWFTSGCSSLELRLLSQPGTPAQHVVRVGAEWKFFLLNCLQISKVKEFGARFHIFCLPLSPLISPFQQKFTHLSLRG